MISSRNERQLKVAILGTRGIPARYGGFETFAEELALRLVNLGVETTVYCESGSGDKLASFHGAQLEYVAATRLGPLTTILFDLRCLWRARKGFDVVYMLGYGAGLFLCIPRLGNGRVWVNMDGIEWMRSKWSMPARVWFRVMEALSVRTAHRVIADAEGIRRHLISRHGANLFCSVIPYGAEVVRRAPDTSLLSRWDLVSGGYYLVVCRLEPENHVKEIIQGYLKSEGRRPLVIVGDSACGTAYANGLLQEASDRIRFIGTVYDKKSLQALRYHAMAYFHGHCVGGTNPSLLEAMGCGNIIVAHDNQFNQEVAGKGAFYFRTSDDIPGLIHHLETLSFEERNHLAEQTRQRIQARYDWDDIAQQYIQIIKEDFALSEQGADNRPTVCNATRT